MLKKIKYSLDFSKALKYDEEANYSKVISILEKYTDFIVTNQYKFPDYYILLAEAYARLLNFIEAEKYFFRGLESLRKTTSFNSDEVRFLQKFIFAWLIYIYKKNNHNQAKLKYERLKDSISFNESNIRTSIKINFTINTSA